MSIPKFKAIYKEGYGERKIFDVHSIEFDVTVNGEIPIAAIDLLQYIGLTDRNGVETFKGDIIRLYRHSDITHKHEVAELWTPNGKIPYVTEVKFILGAFCFSSTYGGIRTFTSLARPGESFEVIGNIYENPELLEVQP